MIAPHLNPAIDAHMRFRLALQVSCPRSVWSVSFCLHEVRRFRQAYPYGWQVANTTLDNLFREHGVPWDDEDEEKVAAGHDRAQTWQDRAFWRTWVVEAETGARRRDAAGERVAGGPARADHELCAPGAEAQARGRYVVVRRGAKGVSVVAGPAYVWGLLTGIFDTNR